ncbi:MAG: hypothetical protein QOH35_665 [Acidobacteriaceae bacterium]|nr:hypothetical protein [Acidobacteriaceae bacterium]
MNPDLVSVAVPCRSLFAVRSMSGFCSISKDCPYLCQHLIGICKRLTLPHRLVEDPQTLKHHHKVWNTTLRARFASQMLHRRWLAFAGFIGLQFYF